MGIDKGVILVRVRRPLEAVSFDHNPDSPADDMPFPFFDNSASIAAQVTLWYFAANWMASARPIPLESWLSASCTANRNDSLPRLPE